MIKAVTSLEVCAVIVARGGSKRIPRKSLLKLNGESLIARKIRQLSSCKKINRVVFGSDSEEMLLSCRNAKGGDRTWKFAR